MWKDMSSTYLKEGSSCCCRIGRIYFFKCSHVEAEKGDLFEYLLGLGYDGFFAVGDKLVHFSEYNNYEYSKPSVTQRNYIFSPNRLHNYSKFRILAPKK